MLKESKVLFMSVYVNSYFGFRLLFVLPVKLVFPFVHCYLSFGQVLLLLNLQLGEFGVDLNTNPVSNHLHLRHV